MSTLIKATGRFAFWFSLVFAVGCNQNPNSPGHSLAQPAAPESTPTNVEPLSLNLDQPLATSIDQLLKSPEFSNGRWGVSVISLNDGKLIYDHNGDHLFTPASNMKVYTTAVALDLLGTDYHWRTSVYADSEPDAAGTIRGDLVLYGRGSPDFISSNRKENSNSIEELVKTLQTRGVKRIQGNVVGDESYFRGDATGQGWQWNDLQWYFGAEASALTVNANSVEVSITPPTTPVEQPKVASNDVDGYVQVTNNIKTVSGGEEYRLGVQRGLSDNKVVVWGQFPVGARGYGASLSVHRPALWAAMMFLRVLRAHGIVVDGSAQYRDSRVPEKDRFDPSAKRELASVTGKSLGEIIKVTNKFSVNLYAELLLRTLGRERSAMLGNDNSGGRELGDDERGVRLIELWLRNQKINTQGLALHDGSGLSRLNLVTPRVTAELLGAIRRTNSAGIFTDSLPIAGRDGTLGGRLQPTEGRVVAKTGALTYDNSLSGYLSTTDAQVYAFSVICNDYVGRGNSIRLIDQLVLALANHTENGSKAKKSHPANVKQ